MEPSPEDPRPPRTAPPRPVEPTTPLGEAVAGMHELFLSLMAGGFTEVQALRIVAYILVGGDPDRGDS